MASVDLSSKAKNAALTRVYVPRSVWDAIKDDYVAEVNKITVGDVADFSNFLGAVIDKKAFDSITGYIDRAAANPDCEIITGGTYDDSTGYFIQPTTIVCNDPRSETMAEEIFGPVLSVHVYADEDFEATLELCDTSEYALTGSIFATDRRHIETAVKHSATALGTSTSTTSPRAPWSVSNPSAGLEEAERTTKPAARSTCFGGSALVPSRRPLHHRTIGPTVSLSDSLSRIGF